MGSFFYGTTSILVAEARAVRDGLQFVVQVGFRNINIEGDNQIIIQAIEGKIITPWQMQHIIEDILHWRSHSIQFTTKHVFREANMAADWFAKFRHLVTDSVITDTCFSPTLSKILDEDIVRRILIRRGV